MPNWRFPTFASTVAQVVGPSWMQTGLFGSIVQVSSVHVFDATVVAFMNTPPESWALAARM